MTAYAKGCHETSNPAKVYNQSALLHAGRSSLPVTKKRTSLFAGPDNTKLQRVHLGAFMSTARPKHARGLIGFISLAPRVALKLYERVAAEIDDLMNENKMKQADRSERITARKRTMKQFSGDSYTSV